MGPQGSSWWSIGRLTSQHRCVRFRPIADTRPTVHHRPMRMEPSASQYRATAIALAIVSAVTAAVISIQWLDNWGGPLLLPLVVAYFAFNVGYLLVVVFGHFRSRGAKLGSAAVALNFAAMGFSQVDFIWTALSFLSVAVALAGVFRLLAEARRFALNS